MYVHITIEQPLDLHVENNFPEHEWPKFKPTFRAGINIWLQSKPDINNKLFFDLLSQPDIIGFWDLHSERFEELPIISIQNFQRALVVAATAYVNSDQFQADIMKELTK